jgi:alanyl-tRNA synthetase
MKKLILGIVVTISFFSCDTKEKENVALQSKVDSLSYQLNVSKESEVKLNEVGILIDSIDASRKALQIKMIEGSSYADYVGRLREINTYVQQTEAKLASLEKSSKAGSKASAASIRRLKADLAQRSEEIVALQLQLVEARNDNMALWVKLNQKDSILWMKDQVIKVNESDIASLEKMFSDTKAENKVTVANMYYNQASTLETVANRTQFAPRKKKAARQEALELYRLALTMGKMEAQVRITELEKQLS